MFERVTVLGRDIPQESSQKKDEIHVGMEGNGKNEDEAACVEFQHCDFFWPAACCAASKLCCLTT